MESTGQLAALPESKTDQINFYSSDSFTLDEIFPKKNLLFENLRESKYGIVFISGKDKISRLILNTYPIVYGKKYSSIGFYNYSSIKGHMVFIYYFPYSIQEITSLQNLCDFPEIEEISILPLGEGIDEKDFISLMLEVKQKIPAERQLILDTIQTLFDLESHLSSIWGIFSLIKNAGLVDYAKVDNLISLPLKESFNCTSGKRIQVICDYSSTIRTINNFFDLFIAELILEIKRNDILFEKIFFAERDWSKQSTTARLEQTKHTELVESNKSYYIDLIRWTYEIKTIFAEMLNTGIVYYPEIYTSFRSLSKYLVKISSEIKMHLPPEIDLPRLNTNDSKALSVKCLYTQRRPHKTNYQIRETQIRSKTEKVHTKLVNILSDMISQYNSNEDIVFNINDLIDVANDLRDENEGNILIEKISGEFSYNAICMVTGLTNFEIPVKFSNGQSILIPSRGADFDKFNDDQLKELTQILDEICQTDSQFMITRNELAHFRADKANRTE